MKPNLGEIVKARIEAHNAQFGSSQSVEYYLAGFHGIGTHESIETFPPVLGLRRKVSENGKFSTSAFLDASGKIGPDFGHDGIQIVARKPYGDTTQETILPGIIYIGGRENETEGTVITISRITRRFDPERDVILQPKDLKILTT